MPSLSIIILAAGEGTRIGTPKWRLKWEGERFMDIILRHLDEAKLTDIYTVMSETEAQQFQRTYPNLPCILNPDPTRGMISSVRIAVEQAPKADAYMILMVDHPFVKASTYQTLHNMFIKYPGQLIQPVVNTKPGHPVVVPAKVFEKGFSDELTITLNDMIKKSKIPVMKVSVKDAEIFRNINTHEDVREFKIKN